MTLEPTGPQIAEPFDGYHKLTANLPPREETVEAVSMLREAHGNIMGLRALDFGCGAGRDSTYMAGLGMQVTAVDSNTEAIEAVAEANPGIDIVRSRFDAFTADRYDLISSQFSLSFSPPETFVDMFRALVASLNMGGIITCNIFGDRDEWRTNQRMTFMSEQEIKELLEGLQVLRLAEVEEEGQLANGDAKHWHYFDLLLTK